MSALEGLSAAAEALTQRTKDMVEFTARSLGINTATLNFGGSTKQDMEQLNITNRAGLVNKLSDGNSAIGDGGGKIPNVDLRDAPGGGNIIESAAEMLSDVAGQIKGGVDMAVEAVTSASPSMTPSLGIETGGLERPM